MKSHIFKLLEGTISESEIIELTSWLKDSKNKTILESYIKDYHDLNLVMLENNIDDAFENVKSKIDNTNYLRLLFKYAAVILLFVSISYVYLYKPNIFNNTSIIVNNNIKEGTDKATLTLEDGTLIPLEKGQNYSTKNITSNGEEIVYQSPGAYKKELAFNYLTIPRGGQYSVKLSDGTKVWLNSESKLKYPVNFIKGETRQVELIYGEAYFDVSPSINHNNSKFKVLSNKQEVEVLGTEFNIKAYPNESNIYTTLVEGKVVVDNYSTNTVLRPNEQSILSLENNKITVKNINASVETSWKRGVFSFKGRPFKEICKVLSRWYDVDFIVMDKDINEIIFRGVLRKNQDLKEILSTIIKSSKINAYEINNKTIIIK